MQTSSRALHAPPGAWQKHTLIEALRQRETLWGPIEDLSESRRARASGGDFRQRIWLRAQALAERDGLARAWRQWRQSSRWLLILMALSAVLAGIGAAAGALGTGARPVNLLLALGGVLGLHLLTLFFWLGSLLWSASPAGSGSWAGELWLWLSRKFVKGEASLIPQAFLAVLARNRSQIWLFGALSHGLWSLALSAAGLTMLLLLASRRYQFNWETTLLSPDSFVVLTQAIGALPRLLGFPMPGEDVIRLSDGLHLLDAQAQALWSSWLLGAVLAYGLLPRLLALAWSLWKWRSRTQALTVDESLPGLAELRPRLMPASEASGPDRLAAPDRVARLDLAGAAPSLAGAGCLLGLELAPELEWPPAGLPADLIDLGRVDSRAERLQVQGRLQDSMPARLVMVCDATQTPDRGVVATLVEWAQLAVQAQVLLVDGTPALASEERRRSWRERLRAAGFDEAQILEQWPAGAAEHRA